MKQPYEQLEVAWAEFNDLDPAGMVACASGTAALHLALEAFRLPQGSECLVPDFSMIACPRAVAMAGLTPVFVDCDERGLMESSLIDLINGGARAVMAVHVYGRRQDMDQMVKDTSINGKQCTYLIEDLAEAHGVKPHKQTDAACWSFYSNKIVCGQEGGAVWFHDPSHAKLARKLRSLGFTDKHDFWHLPRGHNYRLSNANAEQVLAKGLCWSGFPLSPPGSRTSYGENPAFRRKFVETNRIKPRWAAWNWHHDACSWEWRLSKPDAPWVYDLRIPGLAPHQQYTIIDRLNDAGIAARHPFRPCHQQAEFAGCRFVHAPDREPWSKVLSRETLYLPLTPSQVTPASVALAFSIIKEVLDASQTSPAPNLP